MLTNCRTWAVLDDSHVSGSQLRRRFAFLVHNPTMNVQRLKEAEAVFLAHFPKGFDDPAMERIKKSHPVDRLAKFARENLTETTFNQPRKFADTMLTIIKRSSMVSRFEKPPFQAFVETLSAKDAKRLAGAFRKRLVGRKKRDGFDEIVDVLAYHKLARWPVVSALPFYYSPKTEAFVKPSTAKKIVRLLEVDDLEYRARPDWAFYSGYLKMIREIKKHVDPGLTPNNAATTGFLMFTL
jgi:hypothetical protein